MRSRFLGALLLLAFVRGLLYAAFTPAWQSPDEPGHFEYVALIYALGRVPNQDERLPELTLAINTSAQQQQFELFQSGVNIGWLSTRQPPALVGPREAGYQWPLYYLLLTPIYALVSRQDILVQYYALAVGSAALAAVTALAAGLTARVLFPRRPFVQAVIPALVVFWPTQTHIAAHINNDNLATVVAAWAMFALVATVRHGLNLPRAALLLGLAALANQIKGTTLFLIPLLALAPLLVLGRSLAAKMNPAQHARAVLFLKGALAAGVILAVVVLLWPAGADAARIVVERLLWPSRARDWVVATLTTLAHGGIWTPERLAVNRTEVELIWKRLWAVFGWGDVYLADGWYWLAGGLAGAAALGLAEGSALHLAGRGRLADWQIQSLACLALAIPLAWTPLLARMIFLPVTTFWHGRSLLTLLIPLNALFALGLEQLIPRRFHALAAHAMLAGLILLDAASLGLTLIPHYYQ